MNREIMKQAGLQDWVDCVDEMKCPGCNKPINAYDFRDELSKKEYHISGLCQKCQDEIFGGEQDEV